MILTFMAMNDDTSKFFMGVLYFQSSTLSYGFSLTLFAVKMGWADWTLLLRSKAKVNCCGVAVIQRISEGFMVNWVAVLSLVF